jgi:hypothetical protein
MEIVDFIAINFGLLMPNGQRTRIAQIACGYPHFAHLIMRELLNVVYDARNDGLGVTAARFKSAVQNASRSAATRLHTAYEVATKKGTDRYIEVLWAAADGQLLEKQFKSIFKDYQKIMYGRPSREALSEEAQFRNHLNSLTSASHGEVLKRGKVGWYKYSDPMFRSYVRMVAHGEDVDLGDESFVR